MIKDETLGGITPPLTYVDNGKPTYVNCWFNVNLQSGKLVDTSRSPACPTPTQNAGLTPLLGG
jgi:hypothetical protein